MEGAASLSVPLVVGRVPEQTGRRHIDRLIHFKAACPDFAAGCTQASTGTPTMFDTSSFTAADVMTRDVITVHPEDTLQHAAQIMLDHGVAALPVVDDNGKLLGIVSEIDLFRPDEMAEKRARWWLDALAEGEDLSPEFLAAINEVNRPVSRVMHSPVLTVAANTPLAEVAALIARENVRRVVVADGDRLVGVVARRDLVRALAGGKGSK